MSRHLFVFFELVIIILAGCLTAALTLFDLGMDAYIEYYKVIISDSLVFFYLTAVFVFSVILPWFLSWSKIGLSSARLIFVKGFILVLSAVGESFLAIYRLFSGFIAMAIIYVLFHPETRILNPDFFVVYIAGLLIVPGTIVISFYKNHEDWTTRMRLPASAEIKDLK